MDNSSNSDAKDEWETHCQNLFNGELRVLLDDAGYNQIRATGPVKVNDADVTTLILPQFFTDADGNGLDDDGNVGYLIASCARRRDHTAAQVLEVVNTNNIWRLVRSDQR